MKKVFAKTKVVGVFTRISIMFCALFFSILSHAGIDWVGNGGNVIFCETKSSLEVYDYYEGRTLRGLNVELGGAGKTWDQKIEFALARLEGVNPSRARLYRGWLKTFISEVYFFTEGYIPSIPDSGGVILPVDCKLVQVASQRPSGEIMPGDKRYNISQTHWNLLDETSKAGLVLHELIYREGIESGHVSSVRTRYFNQMLSSSNIKNYKSRELLELVKTVGLKYVDYYGYGVDLGDAHYYPDGSIKSVWVPGLKSWIKFSESGKVLKIIPR